MLRRLWQLFEGPDFRSADQLRRGHLRRRRPLSLFRLVRFAGELSREAADFFIRDVGQLVVLQQRLRVNWPLVAARPVPFATEKYDPYVIKQLTVASSASGRIHVFARRAPAAQSGEIKITLNKFFRREKIFAGKTGQGIQIIKPAGVFLYFAR